ncbi:MAG: hypothetical protein H0U97_13765 [Gammaproteobacteria bacterium]|nr:hypothetical protein [Gammaproteobacteria bacterium]
MDRLEDEISDGKVLALVEAFLGQDILDGLGRWTPNHGSTSMIRLGSDGLCELMRRGATLAA